ncbi:5' nucleotidase, NT5C type [Halomarina ordinaria]|uniref:HAD family hydrolase n=1 Tax=Halomarina ordinaria TaxID=3033939 RepID=A0ABD5UAP9_9EURY|nr:hypothetical protein [Halomarina sp. PSRA2]
MNLRTGPERTVLVDVDGTLCANIPRLVEYVDERYGVSLAEPDITEWSYPVEGTDRHVGELIHDAMADRPEEFLLSMDPLPGAAGAMARLRDHGHEVRIATHRPAETHPVTRRWLDDHDVPYDAFVEEVPPDKGALPGDLLVDDYHLNVRNALAAGKAGALFRQPYSDPAACEGALVADSWRDFLGAVGFEA